MKKFKKCNCVDIPDDTIHKIAAFPVRDKKVLIVKKESANEFISLGGSHEGNETHEQALQRESMEELKITITKSEFINRVQDVTESNVPIIIDAYLVDFSGEPTPDSEIVEYLWVDRNHQKQNIKVASITEKYIIPELIKRGLM